MRAKAVAASRDQPYLYQYYNIFGYYLSPLNTTVRVGIARILNAFIEGLNDRDILPKYVIIIPDKDIIAASAPSVFNIGAGTVFDLTLEWLFSQLKKAIK